jgi:hypothetical protein
VEGETKQFGAHRDLILGVTVSYFVLFDLSFTSGAVLGLRQHVSTNVA